MRVSVVVGAAAVTAAVLVSCSVSVEGSPVAAPRPVPEPARTFKTITVTPTPTAEYMRDPRFAEIDHVMEIAAQDARDMWLRDTGKRIPSLYVVGDTLPDASRCPAPNTVATAWMCADGVLVYRQEELLRLASTADTGVLPLVVYAAHEVAHLGQAAHGFGVGTSSPAEERNSDCSAGAYFRRLVDRTTTRFSVTEAQARQAVRDAHPLDGTGIVSADYAAEVVNAFEHGLDTGQLCTGEGQ